CVWCRLGSACGVYIRFFFFFFQAEDGIRDWSVTGVQTCALPIYCVSLCDGHASIATTRLYDRQQSRPEESPTFKVEYPPPDGHRSEERRVGKECRSRWSPYQ